MMKSIRPILLIAALVAAALAGLTALSQFALTLDDIASPTILWAYVGAVVSLIVAVTVAAYLVYRGPRRRLRRTADPNRASADQRLDRIFEEQGFEDTVPLGGYAPLKPGEFCAPEPDPAGRTIVALCGTRRVGKSTLIRVLEAAMPEELAARLVLRELPALGVDAEANADKLRALGAAGLVIFVVDQDLRDFEYTALRRAARARKPIVVAVNKADGFRAVELKETLAAIADKLDDVVKRDDIVAVSAAPAPAIRVTTKADGSEQEDEVARVPNVKALLARLERAIPAPRRQN